MNITIFKTWCMETNAYSYWQDELPGHDKYNLIIGQAIVPDDVQQKIKYFSSADKFLEGCYNRIHSDYKFLRGDDNE